MANGSVRAYGTESPPLYRPQQPSPHNFRMYDDANTQGYSSLHPTQAIVDPISHTQSPYTAPSFFARIDARIQALEKQSIHADGFSRKLVDDAQVSIKNIRQTLSTLDNTVAQHANRITEQEDRLGSWTEAWDMMNERMDNLVTESGRQLTEALLQPMVASMKDILSEVSTYAHEKNAHRDHNHGTEALHPSGHGSTREADARAVPGSSKLGTGTTSPTHAAPDIDQTSSPPMTAPATETAHQESTEPRTRRPLDRINRNKRSARETDTMEDATSKEPWKGRLRSNKR